MCEMLHLIFLESSTLIGFLLYELPDDCFSCVSTYLSSLCGLL